MTTRLTPMERALLAMLDQMSASAEAQTKALNARIDDLTRQLQQHEMSVKRLHDLLNPFLSTPSSTS